MAESLDVGTLSGRIELEDKFGAQVAEISNKLDLLNDHMGKTHGGALEVAEGMLGAEAAMKFAEKAVDLVTDGLKELWNIAISGSRDADIEETFNRMTASAGLAADTLKGQMSSALHGTVDDTDLMIRVNQNLSVGLNLTTEQMSVLAKGAYALAKATGGDTTEALDKLSNAMVTGRTRSIALLTGKIDLGAAEDAYAAKLGISADRLSDAGKQHAAQEVILKRVADATARVGEQHERLADKVTQTKVQWHDFEEQLGIALATSPVLATAFDEIKRALGEAFGGNQANLIKTIASTVDDLAIGVLGLAEYVVDGVGVIGVAWNGAIEIFDSVKAGWAGIAYMAEAALLLIEKGINAVSFGAMDEQVKALETDMDGWYNTMAESQAGIDSHVKAEETWAVATGKVKDKIEEIRLKMVAAKDTTHDYADPLRDVAEAHDAAGQAAGSHATAEGNAGMVIGQTKDEVKKYTDALKEMALATGGWKKVLEEISGDTVDAVKFYLDAGVAMDKLAAAYELSDTQAKAIEKDWKEGNDTLKETLAAVGDLTKAWDDYYKDLAEMSESDVEKTKSSAEEKYDAIVQKLQEAGDDDVEHYNDAWRLYELDVQKNERALILKNQNSKASMDQQLHNARELYQFMQQHSDQYTTEDIANQGKQVAALQSTRDHWNEVGHAIDKNVEKVRTLSGEVLTLKEYEARQLTGGSFDVTKNTFDTVLDSFRVSDKQRAYQMAAAGYSFQEIVQYNTLQGTLPPPRGPRIPGFSEGGVGDFGSGTLAMLHGREAIIPIGAGSGAGIGGDVYVTNYVNGTAADVSRQISAEIIRTLKTIRQFGAA